MKRFALIINHTSEDSHSAVLSAWNIDEKGNKINIETQNKTHKDVFIALNSMLNFVNKRLSEIDYTPPTLSTYRVAIPSYWEMLFPNDRFIVGGFDIPLERTKDNVLCVDVAYLEWKAFRAELRNPENSVLARHMGAVMVYLDKRHENKDYV
jgi:endo-1,4-beta-D-glucanase Y